MLKTVTLAAMAASVAADCMATQPSVARFFTVEIHNGYKLVRSTQPGCGAQYVLYPRGQVPPALGDEYKYFATPLRSVALTQTVSNTFLEILGVSSAASVISSYTVSACMRERVVEGLAVEYVGPSNPYGGGNDTEHALQMSGVDAVFTDPFSASSFEAGDFAAKTICTAETYEEGQLSQAEWIKFYGLFFDKEVEAATSMCGTASRFSCNSISANAAPLSEGSSFQAARVAFASKDYFGELKINTVPKTLALLRNAGAMLPDMSAYAPHLVMHYTGAYEEGYRFNSSSSDKFREALSMFDIVIDESYPYMQTQETIAALYGITPEMQIPAFVNGRVYTLDKTMSHNGLASDIYESAVVEPDSLLADLIAIINTAGTAAEAASTTSFVRHAASDSVTLLSHEMCAAERPLRSQSCDIVFTNLQDEAGLLIPAILVDPMDEEPDATTVAGTPSNADLFTVCERDGYKIVKSIQCGTQYVLYPRGQVPPALGDEYKYFATPLRSVALTQTVSNTFLEILGVSSAASVISSYTVSACMRERVVEGLAVEYVGPSNPYGGGNDTEHALQMSGVDAVFTDPFSASSFEAGDFAAKTICTAETYEEGQLSQAEWIKFYGLFFDKEVEAATSMCGTASRFSCNSISANAAPLSEGSSFQAARVAFASKDYFGELKINTVPKTLALLRNAGAMLPDMSAYAPHLVMHYTGAYEEGYRFNSSSSDKFREALSMFDIVIDESYPYMQTQETIAALYGITPEMQIPAFVNGRVYTLDKTMSHNGLASDIYESAVVEPDSLLADLIAIINTAGTAAEAASTTSFVRHAASDSVTLLSHEMCTDSTGRTFRSASCADTAGTLSLISSVGVIDDVCPTITAVTYPQCPAPPGGNAPGGNATGDNADEEESSSLAAGQITGIVIGAVAFVGIIIGVGLYCLLAKRKNTTNHKDAAYKVDPPPNAKEHSLA